MANVVWSIESLRGVETSTHGTVVTHVGWVLTVSEGEHMYQTEGIVKVAKIKVVDSGTTPVLSGEFVEFSSLGEHGVLQWVHSVLGSKAQEYEQGLLEALEAAKKAVVAPKVTPVALTKPWE